MKRTSSQQQGCSLEETQLYYCCHNEGDREIISAEYMDTALFIKVSDHVTTSLLSLSQRSKLWRVTDREIRVACLAYVNTNSLFCFL